MANKQGYVLAPFAQRRQMQRKHVQAVEQITAEFFFFDGTNQIAIGGGDQPHVHPDRLRASQALELLILQNAQQLGLQLQRDVSYLVEQQSALIRQFQPAELLAYRSGEGSFFLPAQLDFQQYCVTFGAVELDALSAPTPAIPYHH